MFNALVTEKTVVAAYLRISKDDDGANGESNSITKQRELIRRHIASQEDLRGAEIVEYVDDGVSGESTGREAYNRLMADVEKGRVQAIAVKDLSRIGRSMIDVDDLLMNSLIALRVRFIAINDRYDSVKNPLSNLELAVISLANQHYNRDLAQKSMSVRYAKMRRGEYLSCWAIFGYKKSETERNKLEIDPEAAEYVKRIFALAVSGVGATKIAAILNEDGVPTPSVYKRRHGYNGGWRNIDPEYTFWVAETVRAVLIDVRYTGCSRNNVYRQKEHGNGACVHRPQDEWICVPNTHEAIVSEVDFKMAREGLRRVKWRTVAYDHIFYNKVVCGGCGRAMRRGDKYNPRFKCVTKTYTRHYNCKNAVIAQAEIERIVLETLKVYVAALIGQEEMKLAGIRRGETLRAETESRLRIAERALRALEESITKNYTAFLTGKLTAEAFTGKKLAASAAIEEKSAAISSLWAKLSDLSVDKGEVEERLAELRTLPRIEKLDRAVVDMLIDKIIVHGANEIEIVWSGRLR